MSAENKYSNPRILEMVVICFIAVIFIFLFAKVLFG